MDNWLNKCSTGDCREVLKSMAEDGVRVQCVVTSPPTGECGLTRLAEKLMADDAEAVVKAVVAAAKGGDMTAARLVLDRIAPPCREAPVTLELPPLETRADASRVLSFLLANAVG